MTDPTWHRVMEKWRAAFIIILTIVATLVIILIISDDALFLVFSISSFWIVGLTGALILYFSLKDVWNSHVRKLPYKVPGLDQLIEPALVAAGLKFSRRTGVRPVYPKGMTFDLDGGINITLNTGEYPYKQKVFVGPVRDDTRDQVEHVKEIVDGVLAGIPEPDYAMDGDIVTPEHGA